MAELLLAPRQLAEPMFVVPAEPGELVGLTVERPAAVFELRGEPPQVGRLVFQFPLTPGDVLFRRASERILFGRRRRGDPLHSESFFRQGSLFGVTPGVERGGDFVEGTAAKREFLPFRFE